jgi:hypothetical protein
MKRATVILAIAASGVFLSGLVLGATVEVTVTGSVVFNAIGDPPLGNVNSGNEAIMTFTVDSDDFVDGIPGDTRGYVIDPSSFSLVFDTPVTVGLQDPFPAGETPYFTLVEGFPVSDGFFVATSPFSPGGVPLEQVPFQANLDLGYTGDTLDSLDILDALGVYAFDGLTRFGFNIWSIFPDNVAMEIDFQEMTIVEGGGDGGDGGNGVPATSTGGLLVLILIVLLGPLVLRRVSDPA